MNELPEGWVWKKLGEVCKAITGTTPPKDDKDNYGTDIPFVKPPQLFDKPINDAPEKLSKKGAALARILPTHSVLVTCIGNLGRTAINNIPVAFNQQINALIPPSNLDGKFLFYQTQSPVFKNQLENLSSATTVAIVNKGKFETIQIALPPLPVQHAIVTKIEEIFSELDHGVEQLKTARQQLKVYRQAVLKWAFEGRLTNGNEHWKAMTLKEGSSKIVVGYVGPVTQHIVEYNGVPFLSTTHIGENQFLNHDIREVSNDFHQKNKKSTVEPGDILIARHGDSGKACIVPEFIAVAQVSNAVILKPDPKIIIPKFICYRINAERQRMQKMKVGGVFQVVNTKSMEAFQISVPPLSEQHQIVSEIERRLSVCDHLEEAIEGSLKSAEVLRAGVLKRAFEGRLVSGGAYHYVALITVASGTGVYNGRLNASVKKH